MRGKGFSSGYIRAIDWITPAHAGKRLSARLWCPTFRDHPRPCGEKIRRKLVDEPGGGSPPPMRGKVNADNVKQFVDRITPAHAGKSDPCYSDHGGNGDHPRPCGEKRMPYIVESDYRGSPPPMRGKAHLATSASWAGGITPAHAGKSASYQSPPVKIQDHPRPCGEKLEALGRFAHDTGSPPPMRGKDAEAAIEELSRRITPAHAGKSLYRVRTARQCADHPRPCGEKTKKTPKYRHFRFSNQSISFSFSYT